MKHLHRSISLVGLVTVGVVAAASSCSSSPTGETGSKDAGTRMVEQDGSTIIIITEPDGAMYEKTDSGLIRVTVNDSGTIVMADTSVPPGSDATMPGTDGSKPGTDSSMSSCPDTGTPVACTATIATGAVVLSSNYLTAAAAGLGNGGYAYSYSDAQNGAGGTSTICLDDNALCTVGMTDVSNTSGSHYGAGIGFNINQAQATTCTGTPIDAYTVPSGAVGISYKLSNLPPGGVRLAIGNFVSGTPAAGNEDFCVLLTSAQGTVGWEKFNTQCWSEAGDFLPAGGPTGTNAPTHIEFGLPSGTSTESFNFCVESLAFATTLTTPDSGTTVSCSGGSACCAPSSGPAADGDGEFTCYAFDQGTAMSGGNYKTFCGYVGTETGGPGGSGVCQSGALNKVDSVTNVGTNPSYFAAFPSSNAAWGQGAYCGMCVNVTYEGTTLMATIVDECATCGDSAEHIDLSSDLARALNIGTTGEGDVSGVTWEAVACPVTKDIVAVQNSTGQFYFQNVTFPVKSVSGASQNDGFWSPIGSGSVTLTDMIGHTVSAVVPPGGGSLGVQFPATCTP